MPYFCRNATSMDVHGCVSMVVKNAQGIEKRDKPARDERQLEKRYSRVLVSFNIFIKTIDNTPTTPKTIPDILQLYYKSLSSYSDGRS